MNLIIVYSVKFKLKVIIEIVRIKIIKKWHQQEIIFKNNNAHNNNHNNIFQRPYCKKYLKHLLISINSSLMKRKF